MMPKWSQNDAKMKTLFLLWHAREEFVPYLACRIRKKSLSGMSDKKKSLSGMPDKKEFLIWRSDEKILACQIRICSLSGMPDKEFCLIWHHR